MLAIGDWSSASGALLLFVVNALAPAVEAAVGRPLIIVLETVPASRETIARTARP